MKRRDLIKKLEDGGFVFERHGSSHDVYTRGDEQETVPRHNEIDERLARAILRRRGLL
ncbi:type II toxin-antitoxin system HicA family toxin [Faecalicatena contorta]|uniref:Type II toxin-antitoxin system HicA family toxin n=1 Tax=Faecalicatena fissicatena TaxID=290055 RepID=A0ABS2E4U9_9FIRM|nr:MULTISPECIES: type II toxin-antitoxin system HicA family toxin [Clostridia]MBM6684162.1 type II toxin-antitoxin system HicA family toxin [Faecalicatena contorta]MBM6709526.1 type II toxin-antitoxin system HicA family toxin [Faecalicatena contorta]MBM6736667.1 type II toxin-antitoxin system HicA family toxin [Faecalicatena fissicatena]HIX99972.1 type II toxin-antitoxin system HicA family toxin [Candidatus Dorea intestinigallinarum]